MDEYTIESLITELKTTRQEVSEFRFIVVADIVVMSITFTVILVFMGIEISKMFSKYNHKRLMDGRV